MSTEPQRDMAASVEPQMSPTLSALPSVKKEPLQRDVELLRITVRSNEHEIVLRLGDDNDDESRSLRYVIAIVNVPMDPSAADVRQQREAYLESVRETFRVLTRMQQAGSFFGTPLLAASVSNRRPQRIDALELSREVVSGDVATTFISAIAVDTPVSLGQYLSALHRSGVSLSARQLSSLVFQLLIVKLELRAYERTSKPHLLAFTPEHLAWRRVASRPTVVELSDDDVDGDRWTLSAGPSPLKDFRYADQRAEDIAFVSDGLIHFDVAQTLRLPPDASLRKVERRSPATLKALVDSGNREQTDIRVSPVSPATSIDTYLDAVYPYWMSFEHIAWFFGNDRGDDDSPPPHGSSEHFWQIGYTMLIASTLQYTRPEYTASPPQRQRSFSIAKNPWTLLPLGHVYERLRPLYTRLLNFRRPKSTSTALGKLGDWFGDERRRQIVEALDGAVPLHSLPVAINFVAVANHLVFAILLQRALGTYDDDIVRALPASLGKLVADNLDTIDAFALRTYYRTEKLVAQFVEQRRRDKPDALPPLYADRTGRRLVVPSCYVPYVEAAASKLGDRGMAILRNFWSPIPRDRGNMGGGSDGLKSLLKHPYFDVHRISLEEFVRRYIVELTPAAKPLSTLYVRRHRIASGGGNSSSGSDDEPPVATRDFIRVVGVNEARDRVDTLVDRLYRTSALAAAELAIDDERSTRVLRVYESFGGNDDTNK